MNSKAIAAMMAFIMAVIGFAVVSADGTDAAVNKDISVAVGETDATTYVGINEANYVNYGYEVKWYMKLSTSKDYTYVGTFTSTNKGNVDVYVSGSEISTKDTIDEKYKVTISKEDTVGIYNFQVTGVGSTDNASIEVYFKPTITISIDGVGYKTIDDYDRNSLSVKVFSASDGKIEVTFNEDMYVGKYIDKAIGIPKGMSLGDYDWYAVDLPAGLTMSANGHISGIPTDETVENTTFKVYATAHSDGQILYDDSVSITVNEAQSPGVTSFTYEIQNLESVKISPQNGAYIFESNESFKVVVKSTADGNNIITNAVVTIIGASDDGPTRVVSYKSEAGGYVLRETGSGDDDGTGAFQVHISVTSGDTTESVVFSVYIVGQAADLNADIIIAGS